MHNGGGTWPVLHESVSHIGCSAMGDHGGRIVAKVLKSRGVETLFTLSGGHLFSIYDGCKEEGIRILDVRHEQTAAFAAEGIAKATRGVGVEGGTDRKSGV